MTLVATSFDLLMAAIVLHRFAIIRCVSILIMDHVVHGVFSDPLKIQSKFIHFTSLNFLNSQNR